MKTINVESNVETIEAREVNCKFSSTAINAKVILICIFAIMNLILFVNVISIKSDIEKVNENANAKVEEMKVQVAALEKVIGSNVMLTSKLSVVVENNNNQMVKKVNELNESVNNNTKQMAKKVKTEVHYITKEVRVEVPKKEEKAWYAFWK